MHAYLVGGYVRDLYLTRELGYPAGKGDRDWVVVGGTPEEMIQNGFKPIGKDFPVFLHPKTHEEYALARTERKIAPGYHGFVFHADKSITLEEDLKRRDLTINAMALDGDVLIDPNNGLIDIRQKILRHVSVAFKEDPVRILRIARFSAKLPEFTIAHETLSLLKTMVQNGEADSLVAERVFLEMRKTFLERKPSRFITVLQECGLWQRFFKNFYVAPSVLTILDENHDLAECEKFALLTHSENDSERIRDFLSTLKPPAEIADIVFLWNRVKDCFANSDAQSLLSLIEVCDAIRRPNRFRSVLNVARAIYRIDITLWLKANECVKSVNSAKIAASCPDKSAIGQALHQARLKAIEELF